MQYRVVEGESSRQGFVDNDVHLTWGKGILAPYIEFKGAKNPPFLIALNWTVDDAGGS